MGLVLLIAVNIAIWVVIARFVIDWIQFFARDWSPSGVGAVVCESIYTVTDPPLKAIRRVVKPIRLGGVALDLGAMILLIGLYILQGIIASVFR